MARFKVTVQYDGSPYAGFQIQPNVPTVQGDLEKALKKISKGQAIPVIGASRTDAGVHANGQVVHFDYPGSITPENLLRALNSVTDDAIRILQAELVEDSFHARYHALGKRYIYRVSLEDFVSPFKRRYVLNHPYHTDIGRIRQAIQPLKGQHDFQSFCSTKTDKTDFVRTLTRIDLIEKPELGEIWFCLEGDGFLYNMVRIIVGTALQIGDGLRSADEMLRLLDVKDRNQSGKTAAPQGLYLDEIFYMNLEERNAKTRAHMNYKAGHKKNSDHPNS